MTFKTATDVAVWDASVFEWSVYHGEMLAGGVYLGADADVARTRAVAACKDFLTFWKDADPEPPHLQASQSRVCQAAMFAANLPGKTDNSRLVCKSVKFLPVLQVTDYPVNLDLLIVLVECSACRTAARRCWRRAEGIAGEQEQRKLDRTLMGWLGFALAGLVVGSATAQAQDKDAAKAQKDAAKDTRRDAGEGIRHVKKNTKQANKTHKPKIFPFCVPPLPNKWGDLDKSQLLTSNRNQARIHQN